MGFAKITCYVIVIVIFFCSELDRDETILRLLGEYYQTNKLYVPPRTVGGGLPQSFIEFYNFLLEQVAQKLLDEEKERIASQTRSVTEATKLQLSSGSSKIQQCSSSIRSLSTTNYQEKQSIFVCRTISSRSVTSFDIEKAKLALFDKTKSEFEELLKGIVSTNLNYMQVCNMILEQIENILSSAAPPPNFDPIVAAFAEVEKTPEKSPYDVREAVFLLFHGPANTSIPPQNKTLQLTVFQKYF